MSIANSIRSQLVPITPEGYPFIGAFALVSLILFWLWTPLGWIGTVLTVWRYAKWPVMLALVLVIFGVQYYTGPNARVSGVRWIAGGAVLALVVWLVASVALALYVTNFGSYDKTYGTLGGVVVFLTWLWITNMAMLLGAEFNAETERARQLEGGVVGAGRRLRLDEREPASERQRAQTA